MCRGAGPAILIDEISTIVVEPDCTAHVTSERDVRIELAQQAQQGQEEAQQAQQEVPCDPIQLAIFSHRQGCL